MDFLAREEVLGRLELVYQSQRYEKKFPVCCSQNENAVIEFVKESWGREEVFFLINQIVI